MIVCEGLDPFFDGELALAAAQSFRVHLASCRVCQDELRGRMLEMAALRRAAGPVYRRRRVAAASLGIAVAAVAAVAAVWLLRPSPTGGTSVAISVEHTPAKMLGPIEDVGLGDILHLAFSSARVEVWVYVDAQRLVLACPGDVRCHDGGADLVLEVPGTYSIVSTATTDDEGQPHVESVQVR